MTNPILIRRMIQLISQSYALNNEELYTAFETLNSFDRVMDIATIANTNNTSFNKAFEIWKSYNGQTKTV